MDTITGQHTGERQSNNDIRSMLPEELEEYVKELGQPAFRGRQIFSWLHDKLEDSFEKMTDLPESLKKRLEAEAEVRPVRPVVEQVSKEDGTRKYLMELYDGNCIESVLMPYHHGNSVCISTQVGCAMGCRFCASTIGGCVRDLAASEMLGQVYAIQKACGRRVSHVVLMGSGEPLVNLDNVLRFIRLITCEKGLHISQRNITLSTCGIVPGIDRLAREKLQITLALSLHGATTKKRKELMPVTNRYPLEQVIPACVRYYESTGRRVTYEYSLVKGVNDKDADAAELAALLKGQNCHVNLIPVNPVKERSFQAPDRRAVQNFQKKLENLGINVTIRREMGRDIDGACGQLRRRYETS